MAISNKVKRNLALGLVVLGCGIVVARIVDPIMSGSIDGWGWFDIFGACVVTLVAYSTFRRYNDRVKRGIKFGA